MAHVSEAGPRPRSRPNSKTRLRVAGCAQRPFSARPTLSRASGHGELVNRIRAALEQSGASRHRLLTPRTPGPHLSVALPRPQSDFSMRRIGWLCRVFQRRRRLGRRVELVPMVLTWFEYAPPNSGLQQSGDHRGGLFARGRVLRHGRSPAGPGYRPNWMGPLLKPDTLGGRDRTWPSKLAK